MLSEMEHNGLAFCPIYLAAQPAKASIAVSAPGRPPRMARAVVVDFSTRIFSPKRPGARPKMKMRRKTTRMKTKSR